MLPATFVGLSGYTITVVDSLETLHQMCDTIESAGRVAFDTETRSIDYSRFREGALRKQDMRCDLASFATNSNSKKLAWVVVIGMRTIKGLSERDYFSTIKTRIMENSGIVKLAWNYSFDGSLYANYGVGVFNVEDLMVKAHLLRGNMGASLKARCKDVGIELSPFKFKEYWDARRDFDAKATDKKGNLKVTEAQLNALEEPYVNYSAEDAIATMELDPYYDKMLSEDPKRWEYYYRLALPSTICLMRMERRGFPVDTVYLRLIGEQCRQDMEVLEVDIFKKVGHHFNLGSTKALAEVLYTELGYPVVKMTDTGARSTDSDALGRLAQQGYDLAEKVLHWRGKAKLFSAYLDPEAGLTQHITEDGCIHSSFNVCGTESGRLSSCVAANTVLHTSGGVCTISELSVYRGPARTITTHEGRQRRILDVIKKPRAQMYRVKTTDGRTIDCTLDHRFLVQEAEQLTPVWKALREISPGDRLVCPKEVPTDG